MFELQALDAGSDEFLDVIVHTWPEAMFAQLSCATIFALMALVVDISNEFCAKRWWDEHDGVVAIFR